MKMKMRIQSVKGVATSAGGADVKKDSKARWVRNEAFMQPSQSR